MTKKKQDDKCPTCGRSYSGWKPKRVCFLCKQIIGKGHKWEFTSNGTVQHKNCNDVESYK